MPEDQEGENHSENQPHGPEKTPGRKFMVNRQQQKARKKKVQEERETYVTLEGEIHLGEKIETP
jgi:hypothetical protein